MVSSTRARPFPTSTYADGLRAVPPWAAAAGGGCETGRGGGAATACEGGVALVTGAGAGLLGGGACTATGAAYNTNYKKKHKGSKNTQSRRYLNGGLVRRSGRRVCLARALRFTLRRLRRGSLRRRSLDRSGTHRLKKKKKNHNEKETLLFCSLSPARPPPPAGWTSWSWP